MDCYYHNAVPSIARCADCRQALCATCRDERGLCPGCRLAERIDAAAATRGRLAGRVGARSPGASVATVPRESRALAALGYPFWPLALLALLDPSRSSYLRRQAYQAIGFNFSMYALWMMLGAIAHIPLLGMSAWPLLPLVVPVAFVASVVYGFKAWNGDEVRVPLVSNWLDRRSPA